MIFCLNNSLIQIQFFEKSFKTSQNDQVTPLLIIHLEDLETWTDGSITLSPASLHWDFFTNLCKTLDQTCPIPFDFRSSIMLFHFNEYQIVQIRSLEKSITTTPTGELKPCIMLHFTDLENGREYTTKVTMGMKYWDFFLAIVDLDEPLPIQPNTLL